MGNRHLEEISPSEVCTAEKADCKSVDIPEDKVTDEDFTYLFEATNALFGHTNKEDIYEFIAVSLHKFLNDCIVIVNSYDEATDTLHVRAIAGMGTYTDKVICMLGRHPIDVSVTMNNDSRIGLTGEKLKKVAGGIYELTTGSIPRIVCSSVESVLNISSTYAIGITWREQIIGSVAILVRNEIKASSIIEAFVHYSAIALK